MKKALLALAICATLPLTAIASSQHLLGSDGLVSPDNKVVPTLQELQSRKQRKSTSGFISAQSDSDRVQTILVFYQPSYADKYGLDVIHQRIEKSILEDYQKVAGKGREIRILDILPMTSVDNSLPYMNRVDLSGDLVQLGYNYENDTEEGLYDILDVPIDPSTPEGQLTLKYNPDLIQTFRDRRPDEDRILGLAWLGGVNSIVFDGGSRLTTPEEENLLTTVVAHEFGHNHGLQHNLGAEDLVEGAPVDASGEYTSNHATQCGDAHTVMWSSVDLSIDTVDFYSSPYKLHKGEPCGYLRNTDGNTNGAYNQEYYDLYFDIFHSSAKSSMPVNGSSVEFLNDKFSVSESDGKFNVTVTRTGDLSEVSHVYVRTTKRGTATYPIDVMEYKQKAEFGIGESEVTVSFTIMQDMLDENSEVLELALDYPFNTNSTGGNLEVRINDSYISPDDRGSVALVIPTVPVSEGDIGYIEFTRINGSKGDVLISLRPKYHLIEDTGLEMHEQFVPAKYPATEGRDYIMPSSLVVFKDGQTTLRVPVQTLEDLDPEPVKGIDMSLTSLTGDVIALPKDVNGALLIADNDAQRAGVLAIEAASLVVEETQGVIEFTVFRDLDFEGVPFEVIIDVKNGNESNKISLFSGFNKKDDFVVPAEPTEPTEPTEGDDSEGNNPVEEGAYEAVKFFSHKLSSSSTAKDYTVNVSVVNLVDNGLVDPTKGSVTFTVKNNRSPLYTASPNLEPSGTGGGSMNIVYLLGMLLLAGFRVKKK